MWIIGISFFSFPSLNHKEGNLKGICSRLQYLLIDTFYRREFSWNFINACKGRVSWNFGVNNRNFFLFFSLLSIIRKETWKGTRSRLQYLSIDTFYRREFSWNRVLTRVEGAYRGISVWIIRISFFSFPSLNHKEGNLERNAFSTPIFINRYFLSKGIFLKSRVKGAYGGISVENGRGMGVAYRERHGTTQVIHGTGYERNAAGNLIQRIPAVSWTREAGSGSGHLGTPLLVICRWEYKYETWDHRATYGSAVTSPPMRCRSSDTRVCTDAPRICAPMCMRACMPNARGCLILTVCCEKNMLGKCSGWKSRIHGKWALIGEGWVWSRILQTFFSPRFEREKREIGKEKSKRFLEKRISKLVFILKR